MSVLSLDAAKTHLNITSSSYDTELQTVIDAAEAAIVSRIGPIAQTASQSWTVNGGKSAVILPESPVISVDTVTENGTTLTAGTDYTADVTAGIVYRGTKIAPFTFLPGQQNIAVTFTAGYATVPGDLLNAIKEQVRHMWRPQRGPAARPGATATADTELETPTPSGDLAPLVEEMLTAYETPGFA